MNINHEHVDQRWTYGLDQTKLLIGLWLKSFKLHCFQLLDDEDLEFFSLSYVILKFVSHRYEWKAHFRV